MNGPSLQELLEQLPIGAAVLNGQRIVAVNRHLASLSGYQPDELLGAADPFASFLSPEDTLRVAERSRARTRGEEVPNDYEYDLTRKDGVRLHVRARVSRFPLAGPTAVLMLCTDESAPARGATLIRAFVDAAIAVQRERDLAGIFRALGERLAPVGLPLTVCELSGKGFRILDLGGSSDLWVEQVRKRWPLWAPLDEFQGRAKETGQGVLIDDLPGCVALVCERPRAELLPLTPARAILASVPVEGEPGYLISSAGSTDLDLTVASAFGLLGQQLGAAIETTRRLGEVERSNRELVAMNNIAMASATLGSGSALQAALEQLADSLSVDSAALFHRQGSQLLLTVQRGFDPTWTATAARLPVDDETPWGRAATSAEPVLFQLGEGGRVVGSVDGLATPPWGLTPLRLGKSPLPPLPPPPRSDCIALPLLTGGVVIGVLVAARRARPLGRDDLRLLSTLAAQLAVSLQNALLFEETQRRVEELSLLLELGQEVVGSLDLAKVLQAGAHTAARALDCTAAYVLLSDGQTGSLRCAAREEPDDIGIALGDAVPLDVPTLTALAFTSGEPQISNDSSHDKRIDRAFAELYGCRATLAVPLLSHERSLGVLLLIERTERRFAAQDVHLATHAAQLISAAIENAGLYAEQRARAEEATLLNEVGRTLAGSLELRPLLDIAGETLRKVVDASHWGIFLVDSSANRLRGIAASPERLDLVRSIELPLDGPSFFSTALREQRVIQVSRIADLPPEQRVRLDQAGVRSLVVVPLLARDEVLGALVLYDERRERTFAPAEVERAIAVSGQLALALLSSRLYEDLRTSYTELARTQAELIDRERLAALGELSASIAHEVRNPLGVIFNSIGSLRRLLKPAGDVELLLDIVGEEADRLNRMVGDLLNYSRPVQPSVQPLQLRALLEEALASARLQNGTRDGVKVRISVAHEVATVRADGRLMRQALLNLFLNALQAMPRGGTLTIRGSRTESGGRVLAQLSIQDSGPGIAPDARAKVFQPFFTTKPTGTGLGLAVVKRIVEGHGGTIALGRGQSGGAEFLLFLPLDVTG